MSDGGQPRGARRLAVGIGYDAWFVAGLGLVAGGVLLAGAGSIAPPIFDPLGSAAVPRAGAICLMIIGLLVPVQQWARERRLPAAGDPARTPAGATRVATLGMFSAMVSYLLAMGAGLGFAPATVIFTIVAIPLVAARWRLIPVAVAVALVLGFGSEWLFTRVFFVDLPGTH